MAEGHASPQQGSTDVTPHLWTQASIGLVTMVMVSSGAGASSLELLGSRRLPLLLTFITLLPLPLPLPLPLLFLLLLLSSSSSTSSSSGPAACLLSAVSKSPHTAQHYSMQRSATRNTLTLITDIRLCSPIKNITSWLFQQIYRMKIRHYLAL